MRDANFLVAIKPAPGHSGPTLVSDDPAVVQATLDAIARGYARERTRPSREALGDRADGAQPPAPGLS